MQKVLVRLCLVKLPETSLRVLRVKLLLSEEGYGVVVFLELELEQSLERVNHIFVAREPFAAHHLSLVSEGSGPVQEVCEFGPIVMVCEDAIHVQNTTTVDLDFCDRGIDGVKEPVNPE